MTSLLVHVLNFYKKMAQTILITLTLAGTDTGPFDLFSNADGYSAPFASGVSKISLTSGYLATTVADAATTIRVTSKGVCTNSIDIPITTSS